MIAQSWRSPGVAILPETRLCPPRSFRRHWFYRAVATAAFLGGGSENFIKIKTVRLTPDTEFFEGRCRGG
jgi:hypothetical protein